MMYGIPISHVTAFRNRSHLPPNSPIFLFSTTIPSRYIYTPLPCQAQQKRTILYKNSVYTRRASVLRSFQIAFALTRLSRPFASVRRPWDHRSTLTAGRLQVLLHRKLSASEKEGGGGASACFLLPVSPLAPLLSLRGPHPSPIRPVPAGRHPGP